MTGYRKRKTLASQLLAIFIAVLAFALGACAGDGSSSDSTSGPTSTPADSSFDAESYFRGQTVAFIVGTAPGGPNDLISRAFATVAPAYTPGNPRIEVQNMPGGGHLTSLQHVLREPADGLTLNILHRRWSTAAAFGTNDAFPMDDAVVIGSMTAEAVTVIRCTRREIAGSWEDVLALGRLLTAGATGPSASSSAFVEIAGGPVRNIYGYGGLTETDAAFDRGELDLTSCGPGASIHNTFPELIEELVPLFYSDGPLDPEWLESVGFTEEIHRWDELPGVQYPELVVQLGLALEGAAGVGHVPIWTRPGTPEHIADVWRETLRQVTQDPEFQSILAAGGMQANYGSPEDVRASWQSLRELPREAQELLTSLSEE